MNQAEPQRTPQAPPLPDEDDALKLNDRDATQHDGQCDEMQQDDDQGHIRQKVHVDRGCGVALRDHDDSVATAATLLSLRMEVVSGRGTRASFCFTRVATIQS